MNCLLLAELASDLPQVSGFSPMRDDDFRNGAGEGKPPFDLCVVCGDKASGRHYGAISCEGCKGFFKRSIRKHLGYICRGARDCEVTKHCRNRCQYCRLQKCLSMGMRADSVQSERRPIDLKLEKPSTPPLTNSSRMYGIRGAGIPASGYLSDVTSELVPTTGADLSTLASVVTTLANIKYWQQDGRMSRMSSGGGAVVSYNAGGDSSNEGMMGPNMGGSEGGFSQEKVIISKAFDSMAKAALHGTQLVDGMAQEEQSPHGAEDSESLFELEGPLLQECHMTFHLTTPHPAAGASFLNEHYICESASRLLFLSVHWARSVPAFQLLTPQVQTTLVRGSWSELFTLGLAQCSQVMSLPTILTAIVGHLQSSVHQDRFSAVHLKQVTDHICKLQDFVKSMLRLQVDDHEYAYLKGLVLFSPDHPSLPSARQVEKFQEKAYQELRSYINQTFPETNDRFPRLLLRLPVLRSLQPSITEELFFSALIGNVQIESIIPYILKMDSSEYTPADGPLLSNQPEKAKD